ncbi:MAG: ShlB/FhaC/HecB family hemolysin secretion/activation protein [Leptolyngbya sp. SIO4C1]|nr:ShlB/FhaC/HecB family hemolysin secretion/activation protein [Leptolyngbya sp. SIO4C1]
MTRSQPQHLSSLIKHAAIIGASLLTFAGPGASLGHAQNAETITPRDIVPLPPEPPEPQRPPELPEDPDELLPVPPAPDDPTAPPEVLNVTLFVTAIEFRGNTIFDTETLTQLVQAALDNTSPTWTPERLTVNELLALAQVITNQYDEAGYSASGALVRVPETTQTNGVGNVIFDIQEGEVESIGITGTQRLREGYVRSRLGIAAGNPLNVEEFQEKLQLLQLDPLIEQIRAEVNQSATPANSLVTVKVEEARSISASLGVNNNRPPSVSTFQQQAFFTQANLLGIGDSISVGYSRTDGSDSLSAFYELPLGSRGTTVSLSYSPGWNDIVDSDFFDIDRDGDGPDIQSESETYEIQLRHPVIRSVRDQTYQELGVSLVGYLRDSRSFLFGDPFPLSVGAAVDGKTRVAALRFEQDYTLRDAVQVFAIKCQGD